MKFLLEVKPKTFKYNGYDFDIRQSTVNEVRQRIGSYDTLRTLEKQGIIRAYSLEKRRSKLVTEYYKGGAKKGQVKSVKKIPTHTIATYYDFPASLLNLLKLRVVQHSRHFEIVPSSSNRF